MGKYSAVVSDAITAICHWCISFTRCRYSSKKLRILLITNQRGGVE